MSRPRVRGHEGIVRSFDAAWRKNRLGHAYLFVGPTGVGKHTLARELARALLCETRSSNLKACGRCASCALVDAGTHPDLILVARPDDKMELPIEVVRGLIEQLSLKPARGHAKIGQDTVNFFQSHLSQDGGKGGEVGMHQIEISADGLEPGPSAFEISWIEIHRDQPAAGRDS